MYPRPRLLYSPDENANGGGGAPAPDADKAAAAAAAAAKAAENKPNDSANNEAEAFDLMKKRAAQAEARAKKLEADLETERKQKSNASKTLEERHEAAELENQTLREQMATQKKQTIENMKLARMREEAAKLGLRNDAADAFEKLVNPDEVTHFESDNGRIVFEKADQWAKRFKEKNSFLFGNPGSVHVNAGGGTGARPAAGSQGKTPSTKELRKLEGKPEYSREFAKWNEARKEKAVAAGKQRVV